MPSRVAPGDEGVNDERDEAVEEDKEDQVEVRHEEEPREQRAALRAWRGHVHVQVHVWPFLCLHAACRARQ